MTVITGKNVAINGVSNGGAVEIVHTSDAKPVYHSSGQGGSDRADGNIDFIGSYRAWGHTPSVFINDAFALAYTLTGTSNGEGATVRCIGLDIIVLPYDPSGHNAVFHVVHFGADGQDLSAAGATCGAAAPLYSTKGLGCTISGSAQTDVVSMILSFRSDVIGMPDSSSSGVSRRPAGNLDWNFHCFRHVADMADIPALNALGALKMYVTSELSWDCSYGKVLSRQRKFDKQSGEILGVNITAGKAAGAAGEVGTIKDPAGATKWP